MVHTVAIVPGGAFTNVHNIILYIVSVKAFSLVDSCHIMLPFDGKNILCVWQKRSHST